MLLPSLRKSKADMKTVKTVPRRITAKVYGGAKFEDKTGKNRTGEKNAKLKRELAMVESPFKSEVADRIKLLKSLKKMIQKVVTGAQPKKCPGNRTTCAEKEKVKGPYLVSLSTVKKLAEIIRLTPHDGPTRGKRMLKLKQERSKYVEAKKVRRVLIANILAGKKTLSRMNLTAGSKAITDKDVEKFAKRLSAAKRGEATRAKKKAQKIALQTKTLNKIGARSSSRSGSSSSTQSASASRSATSLD